MPRGKRKRTSFSDYVVKRPRCPERYIWVRLPSMPVPWPAEVREIHEDYLVIFINSDNAILNVKEKKVKPFFENNEATRQKCIDILTKKKLSKTLAAFHEDIKWVERAAQRGECDGESHDNLNSKPDESQDNLDSQPEVFHDKMDNQPSGSSVTVNNQSVDNFDSQPEVFHDKMDNQPSGSSVTINNQSDDNFNNQPEVFHDKMDNQPNGSSVTVTNQSDDNFDSQPEVFHDKMDNRPSGSSVTINIQSDDNFDSQPEVFHDKMDNQPSGSSVTINNQSDDNFDSQPEVFYDKMDNRPSGSSVTVNNQSVDNFNNQPEVFHDKMDNQPNGSSVTVNNQSDDNFDSQPEVFHDKMDNRLSGSSVSVNNQSVDNFNNQPEVFHDKMDNQPSGSSVTVNNQSDDNFDIQPEVFHDIMDNRPSGSSVTVNNQSVDNFDSQPEVFHDKMDNQPSGSSVTVNNQSDGNFDSQPEVFHDKMDNRPSGSSVTVNNQSVDNFDSQPEVFHDKMDNQPSGSSVTVNNQSDGNFDSKPKVFHDNCNHQSNESQDNLDCQPEVLHDNLDNQPYVSGETINNQSDDNFDSQPYWTAKTTDNQSDGSDDVFDSQPNESQDYLDNQTSGSGETINNQSGDNFDSQPYGFRDNFDVSDENLSDSDYHPDQSENGSDQQNDSDKKELTISINKEGNSDGTEARSGRKMLNSLKPEHKTSQLTLEGQQIIILDSDEESSTAGVSSSDDEDYVDCSDLEEHTDVGGISKENMIKEKHKERDVNQPTIYIRRFRKSSKSSKAQSSRKKPGNTRVYDNYHCCFYCGEMRMHIKAHLKTHMEIPEVKTLFENKDSDFIKIRKLGDHKHNVEVIEKGCGEIILSRRPTVLDISLFGPCPECKDWLLLKNLKCHYRSCSKSKLKISKGRLVVQSQVLSGVISTNPSKLMLEEVFPGMLLDKISKVAKNDPLIVALGESWLRRSIDNKEKRRYYTSQHMRLMARLLIELQKEDEEGSCKCFSSYLSTQNFDKIVLASMKCCLPYMDDIEDLQSPSNAIKLKYDIRRAVNAKWAFMVKQDPHSLEAREMQTFLDLISLEWGERLTKVARSVLVRRSFLIKKDLPTPEDVLKITKYITEELQTVNLAPENFFRIVQLAQTRLMLYNKRRSGEIDVISLESFASKTKDVDELDQSVLGDLTKVEEHLLKTQEMMLVRGKGHRPLPVLIPEDAKAPLEYIASAIGRKGANVETTNTYLFPNKVGKYTRAYDSLKQTCNECSLSAPGRITSVSLRKYTATLSQVLNLDKYQIDWLCSHLGHSTNVHKTYYRHMSGFIERVHLSKLFLLQDLNMMGKCKGKKLDEIDISELIFPNSEPAENVEPTAIAVENSEFSDDRNIDVVVFEDEAGQDSDSDTQSEFSDGEAEKTTAKKPQKPKKAPCKRTRWDEDEISELKLYFGSYLESKICPRKKAIELAKKQSMKRDGKLWRRTNDKIVKKISNLNHK